MHYRLVSKPYVTDNGSIWPRYKVLTDLSGANPEKVYDGEAHGEARAAGIETCLDVEDWQRTYPTPFDCVACAVEEGLAVMVEWNLDLIDTRALSVARAHASARAREGMWDQPTTPAEQVQALGDPIMRHAIDLRAAEEGDLDSVVASCGERVGAEQLGAWFSNDEQAWALFAEVAVWCTECFKDVDDDEDEEAMSA